MTTPSNACQHCGEPVPFRWMGSYHCRQDETLAGPRWEQTTREWR
jgi:hypothetical protein